MKKCNIDRSHYLFDNQALVSLIVPLIIEQLLTVLVGMADSIMVANVGEAAVSGVSLVDQIMVLLINIFAALATGGAVVAGQYLGQKNKEQACKSTTQLMWSMGFISLVITAFVYACKYWILHGVFGQIEADVMHHADVYLLIVTASIPFIALYNGGAAVFRAAQTVHDDVEVKLAHAADHRLTRILVGVHREGGVLFSQLAQGDAELVEVLLGLRLHGQTDHRLGEGHLLQHDGCVLGAERVARANLLETYGSADIAGADGLHRILLVGVHLVDAADTLALAAAGVQDVGTGIELTRVYAHESQTAYERVGSDLERQTAERIVLGGVTRLFLLGFGVDTRHCGHVERRRQESHHVVEQFLHALVVERRTAEHRDDLHRDRRLADRCEQLVGGDRIGVLEELLHQRIVGGSHLLDELAAPLGGLGLHRLGNLLQLEVVADGLVVVIIDSVIIYKVYQTFELVLGADRQNDRKGRSSEVLLDLCAHRQEVGARAVHLVDVTQTGHVVLVGLTPYGLRLRLHAAYGAERGDSAVQHAQRTLHLDREVDVSRGVDQVERVPLSVAGRVLHLDGVALDGDSLFAFEVHVVEHLRLHFALVERVGLLQQTVCECRFAVVDVGYDAEISDVFHI